MEIFWISLLTMGGLGFSFAAILALAGEKLKVKEDPRLERILEALPGSNCGACGFVGCHELAEKIAAQGSLENLNCPPGGSETEEEIAEILGIKVEVKVKKRAVVRCGGGKDLAQERAIYSGIKTCAAANTISGGPKACPYGCLGYGDCVKACPFGAIYLGEDDLPKIIEEKCTACGLCLEACPRKIIELVSIQNRVIVNCISMDPGAQSRKVCKVSCIACKLCEKAVPEVFQVVDNLAGMNYEEALEHDCTPAIEKCPTKCIIKI